MNEHDLIDRGLRYFNCAIIFSGCLILYFAYRNISSGTVTEQIGEGSSPGNYVTYFRDQQPKSFWIRVAMRLVLGVIFITAGTLTLIFTP